MSYMRAVCLMLIAMVGFVLADLFIKLATPHLSNGQILAPMCLFSLVIYTGLCLWKGIRPVSRDFWHPIVISRTLSEMAGIYCMIAALASNDFALVAAITQAAPIIATFGAVFLLNEQVGWRRWAALFAGFAGVLLIVRPGTSAFDPAILWALGAVTGMGMRDLLTRALPAGLPTLRMAAYGVFGGVLAGALHLVFVGDLQPITGEASWYVAAAAFLATIAYLCMTFALRAYDISAIAPFRYTRIVFGLCLGVLVFGELLDPWMLIGTTITVGAGLFIFFRENYHTNMR